MLWNHSSNALFGRLTSVEVYSVYNVMEVNKEKHFCSCAHHMPNILSYMGEILWFLCIIKQTWRVGSWQFQHLLVCTIHVHRGDRTENYILDG